MRRILAIDMGKFKSVACLYGIEEDTQQGKKRGHH